MAVARALRKLLVDWKPVSVGRDVKPPSTPCCISGMSVSSRNFTQLSSES